MDNFYYEQEDRLFEAAAREGFGWSVYDFSGALANPFAAQADVTYWIGIIDPTDNNDWYWASASGGDGKHVATIGGTTNSFDDDMSFILKGTQAVPEPASLLAVGFGVISVLRRRRQG